MKFYPYKDVGLTFDELLELPECVVTASVLRNRLANNWPVERAVITRAGRAGRQPEIRQFSGRCQHGPESFNKSAQHCRICGEGRADDTRG